MKKASLGKIILISIYSIIFVLFIWNWMREYSDFVEYHAMFSGYTTYSFPSVMRTMALTSVFRVAIFSIPIAIGILWRKRIGWTLITSYLYFFAVNNILIQFKKENISDWGSWAFSIGSLVIIGVLILLMTKLKTVQKFHKIADVNKTILNLIAFGIGLILSLLLIVWKNYMLQQYL